MTEWTFRGSSLTLFRNLFIGNPQSFWSILLVWLVRLTTISLLLRTYIVPWLLALTSKHFRVRSISLRSIKGLYFNQGRWICRAERIGYVFSSVDGKRRLTVRIDGLKVEMQKNAEESTTSSKPHVGRHRRNLTLADLHPSPLAGQLWKIVTGVAVKLEPWLRPILRTYVVACLRIGIRWLPAVSQALSFELRSTVFNIAEIPGTQVIADEINLHAELQLTQIEDVLDKAYVENVPPLTGSWRFHGMAAWRRRVSDSLRRAMDMAWGRTKGTAVISFKLSDIAGTTPARQIHTATFFRLPGMVSLESKLHFHPKSATIDANSVLVKLKVDEVAIKVDLLNEVLRAVVPQTRAPSLIIPPIKQSSSQKTHLKTFSLALPLSPTPSGSLSDGETTPLKSPAVSGRSRSSTLFSSRFLPTSPTGSLLSLNSRLLSPGSSAAPFFGALSSSMSSRSKSYIQPCYKLKDSKYKTSLSTIRTIKISVSTVNLSFTTFPDHALVYKTVIKDCVLDFHPSIPSTDPLHAQWLGRTTHQECFDPETYGLQFSVTTVMLERHKQGDIFPLIALGSVNLQAVMSQWPAPWLTPSSFMKNNPNAPFFALSLNITGAEVTDRLNDLQDFLQSQVAKPTKSIPTGGFSLHNWQIPQSSIRVNCGTICARVICDVDDQENQRTLEMRTNGFEWTCNSSYDMCSESGNPSMAFNVAHLTSFLSFNMEPLLLHVRSDWTSVGYSSDNDFMDAPAILSIGPIESTSNLTGDAEEALDIYRVHGDSLICDTQVNIDTFCIELWHADVVSAAVRLLSIIPTRPPAQTKVTFETPKPISFLSGALASLTVTRFIAVITAPDINPDEADISRGIGVRSFISVEYYGLNSRQAPRVEDLKRAESRLVLGLPEERVINAVARAQALENFSDVAAFARASINNLIVRSAVATQFESNDPFLAGRDDLYPTDQEFLRMEALTANVTFAKPSVDVRHETVGDIEVNAPRIQGNFQLGNIYAILLASQTLTTLAKIRPLSQSKPPGDTNFRQLTLSVRCLVQTLHVLWALPNQTIVSHIENASFDWRSGQAVESHFKSLALWVPLPMPVHRWEHDLNQKWDELLTLYQWNICLPVADHAVSISTKGDSLRLRIPHGYILADLIFDAVVVIKAVKHLVQVVQAGVFTDIPAPEAEGPKLSPNITLDIRYLCIELIDDPFEAKLGAIWRAGLEAAKQRLEREEAFTAKVAAIHASSDQPDTEVIVEGDHDYRFTARHTVTVEDARRRLNEVHFLDWKHRLQHLKKSWSNQEMMALHSLYGPDAVNRKKPFSKSKVANSTNFPPLFRLVLASLHLSVALPSFPLTQLPDFLFEQGQGLPKDTQFSLLIPLHINFTLNSLKATLRDYPIPLIHVQGGLHSELAAWTFDSDIVIAEEMGSQYSVDWVKCPVILANQGIQGASPLHFNIPKTIMPVKSYANPKIRISTSSPTVFSWGISYNPTIQDLVRIIESLTPNSRDPSPPVGFWDKLRLIAHWRIRILFDNEARFYLKGSRSPTHITDEGAGFVLVWKGQPSLLIGYPNDQNELIQVISEGMLIAIPRFGETAPDGFLALTRSVTNPYRKICAELHSGVRYGVGFMFERTCEKSCPSCSGTIFQRQCRMFDFIPHYAVRLETKYDKSPLEEAVDSYRHFRSDFIHFSFSLTASTKQPTPTCITNALHLTPKAFTHFWAWFSLFDSIPTLRIRQGNYFPVRSISPKFGRHIATIKYRIILTKLFVMHGYIDDSRETWNEGITPWIGVKGIVDELRVDMHQRDEETKVRGIDPHTTKVTRHKPFYAAEVVLGGLDLRAVFAIFEEPLKEEVTLEDLPQINAYRKHDELPKTPISSSWYNASDFLELDWSSSNQPTLHYLPLATCPHFAYFKKNAAITGGGQQNKFGVEPTHLCLLGQDPSISQVQMILAAENLSELQRRVPDSGDPDLVDNHAKMVTLLQDYISFLEHAEADVNLSQPQGENYHMPRTIVLPEEWEGFDHVYQIHCPLLSLDKATRDIMIQYYHCSRERKGFEYHLATRAVKFIRDQAKATTTAGSGSKEKCRNSINTAQLAASALRKLLRSDGGKPSIEVTEQENLGLNNDPLDGWSDGVELRKSHCCFLMKPQVVLKGVAPTEVCIVAATQAKLQSFAIMDKVNLDDPISGKIMSRSYASLSGLQIFSPTRVLPSDHLRIPLEVLIDLRGENRDFERLVPQTDATIHYDKFNRLRLRNDVTSSPISQSSSISHTHLHDQTDLIRVHVPKLTVSASDRHFQDISNVVTKLLLFSDATHKARLDKLETLLFTYDFTDLSQAADVIVSLQGRLRAALETERMMEHGTRQNNGDENVASKLQLKAHIILLAEELNYLFDAIKLAQDRTDGRLDQKSAVLLHASSSELSWKMLGDEQNLIAKLVVQHSNFYWLRRQDSALVNDLAIGNLQAFDGSSDAIWAEILSKSDEPAGHLLHKRNLFLQAHWTILPPVGGISIYETFEVSLHPLKVQIDAKVGRRIMEYVWPARRHRLQTIESQSCQFTENVQSLPTIQFPSTSPLRTSLDSPRTLNHLRPDILPDISLGPPTKKLGVSRSFTDLRKTGDTGTGRSHMFPATVEFHDRTTPSDVFNQSSPRQRINSGMALEEAGDAAVMKTRSSKKTFVFVKIASMNLVLSIIKEGSFECHDVHIKTRDLLYRNQTSSFEELVNQFIPSNMNWRGWMKMVFHQPLIPVFPVAKEILSKTKWASLSKTSQELESSQHDRANQSIEKPGSLLLHVGGNKSYHQPERRKSSQGIDTPTYATQITSEPDSSSFDNPQHPLREHGRKRLLNFLHRHGRSPAPATNERRKTRPSLTIPEKD